MTVTLKEMQDMLSIGKTNAYRVGRESGAAIHLGRRTIYSVEKIKAYLDAKTEEA